MDKRKIKGACLLRTFDMLRDMSPEEAKTFSLLLQICHAEWEYIYYIDFAGFFCEECRNFIQSKGL